jgi:two-component system NtrC family sensor kinase
MRIGRRLTVVLWLVVTPVLVAHTYWRIHRSTNTYLNNLRRETRAASQSLVPALENDIHAGERDQVRDVLQRGSIEGTIAAVFHLDGTFWSGPRDMPKELTSAVKDLQPDPGRRVAEFERTGDDRYWVCRIAPLSGENGQLIGYLLVARDWTDLSDDLRARAVGSVVEALIMMGVVAATISFFVRRYVSQPLAELSRKMMRFSSEANIEYKPAGDEVNFLTEEFRKLDAQLIQARASLLKRHRRELELERELERADRLATIGMLASGLAHEIGTPMSVIRARAEHLLQSEPSSPKTQQSLKIFIAQIDRISHIVRILLNYARARESRKMRWDAREIIDHALALVETEAGRRRIALVKRLSDTPLFVDCDADQLQQVFVNLAMNALDAMVATGGILYITADTEAANNTARVKVVFEDTGPGVAAQYQDRVFDPFFTTKGPGQGTGMGLAVSQSIMRDHNGEITLTCGSHGARFVVTMPIAQDGTAKLAPRSFEVRS